MQIWMNNQNIVLFLDRPLQKNRNMLPFLLIMLLSLLVCCSQINKLSLIRARRNSLEFTNTPTNPYVSKIVSPSNISNQFIVPYASFDLPNSLSNFDYNYSIFYSQEFLISPNQFNELYEYLEDLINNKDIFIALRLQAKDDIYSLIAEIWVNKDDFPEENLPKDFQSLEEYLQEAIENTIGDVEITWNTIDGDFYLFYYCDK